MKFNKLEKKNIKLGNSSDTDGAVYAECLILGSYPSYDGYSYIVLAPMEKEIDGFKHYIAFASKAKEGFETELISYKALNLYDGGPAEFWGANPNQPQYKMYEGERLDLFVSDVYRELKKGTDPKIKILKIVKGE